MLLTILGSGGRRSGRSKSRSRVEVGLGVKAGNVVLGVKSWKPFLDQNVTLADHLVVVSGSNSW